MLTAEDKQWLSNQFDERFAEQDKRINGTIDSKFAEQDKRINATIDSKFAEQDKRVNATIDSKFDVMISIMDRRFAEMQQEYRTDFAKMMKTVDERFDVMMKEIDRKHKQHLNHIDFLFESKIMPDVKTMLELIPYAGASYEKLEQRVSDLNFKYEVLAVKTGIKIPEE